MAYTRRNIIKNDFINIRDFLQKTYEDKILHNWLIDRWNFCRYVGQIMHGTFDTWLDTIGLWVDENDKIVAIVHSDGEKGRNGVFFQFSDIDLPDELLNEMICYAESNLYSENNNEKFINFRVDPQALKLKAKLKTRGYIVNNNWKDSISSMEINDDYKVNLPEGFRLVDAFGFSYYQKGLAHGRAFGYYKSNVPDNDVAERAFESMTRAPDYDPNLDLALIDKENEIASFVTVWYDNLNQIGILEPVGTIPKYRKIGLAKNLIYEGVNRIKRKGARKMYVGSEQKFYFAIGFSLEAYKEIWQKKWIS